MVDFRSVLESIVLIPLSELKIDKKESNEYDDPLKYNVPYNFINFLHLVRNHYYKYNTTFYIFSNASAKSYADLLSGEMLKNVSEFYKNPTGFNAYSSISGVGFYPLDEIIELNRAYSALNREPYPATKDINYTTNPVSPETVWDLIDFIKVVTLGYIPSNKTIVETDFLGKEDDNTKIVNRIMALSKNVSVLRNGVYVSEKQVPRFCLSVNGTSVVNNQTIPSPKQAMAIINEVLEGVYKYYTPKEYKINTYLHNSVNSWIANTMPSSRFRTYLKYFTDGKITLEYLKSIQVQDRILKIDLGKDMPLFPAFLILKEDTTNDPYDTAFLRVNSTNIKQGLNDVINYIVNQLFAQDINLLNTMGARFKKSVDNNILAKNKLQEEKDKLDKIDKELQASIIEAKKIFTTYEILVKGLANKPDPVTAYQQELDAKMEKELATYQVEQTKRLNDEMQSKREAELKAQIAEQQAEEKERLAKQAKLAYEQKLKEEAYAKEQIAKSLSMQQTQEAMKQTAPIINGQAVGQEIYTPSVIPVSSKATTLTPEQSGVSQKSSVAPLVAGIGLLALLSLTGGGGSQP